MVECHRRPRRVVPWSVSAVPPSSIVGVGCTAQWSGTVAVRRGRGAAAARGDLDGLPGQHGDETPDAGPGQRARLRRAQAPALDPAHRGRPESFGQGPRRAHPVDPRGGARRLWRHVQVPGAGGLAEPTPDGAVLGVLRLDRGALGDRQPAHRRRSTTTRRCCACRGSSGPSFPTSSRRPRSWAPCGPRRPRSSAFRPACPWRPGPGTCIRPRWGPGRSPTSTATSTSGRRRGSRATCPSRRPTSFATWHPSRPPFPAATWWPTSTRRRAHA